MSTHVNCQFCGAPASYRRLNSIVCDDCRDGSETRDLFIFEHGVAPSGSTMDAWERAISRHERMPGSGWVDLGHPGRPSIGMSLSELPPPLVRAARERLRATLFPDIEEPAPTERVWRVRGGGLSYELEMRKMSEFNEHLMKVQWNKLQTADGFAFEYHKQYTSCPQSMKDLFACCEKHDNKHGMPIAHFKFTTRPSDVSMRILKAYPDAFHRCCLFKTTCRGSKCPSIQSVVDAWCFWRQ